eukprot:scaffold1809_cov386-Prasinococcus_capsulatus_cf.AAC.44
MTWILLWYIVCIFSSHAPVVVIMRPLRRTQRAPCSPPLAAAPRPRRATARARGRALAPEGLSASALAVRRDADGDAELGGPVALPLTFDDSSVEPADG